MKPENRKKSPRKLERLLGICALAVIVIAWIVGTNRAEADLAPFLKQALPEANRFEPSVGGSYAAWKDQAGTQLLGYVTTGAAHGYGGELKVAVAVDKSGTVLGLTIIGHKETASFLQRVLKKKFLKSLQGKTYSDSFMLGQDVDSITGATSSSRALADAVRKASRKVASKNLGFSVIPETPPKIQFGVPEAVLLSLFAIGIVGRLRRFKYKKTARWVSMLAGLAVIGFVYNKPLTIVLINRMLLGFWPEWQIHLYWYILLAGILFVFTADNRNPYCEWFCPFGSAQECLGFVGGAKVRTPEPYHTLLRWFQRTLALGAIVLALLYRNPSVSSYEVFGVFFRLIGSSFQFALLGIVLVASLFLRRPWCSYLCPLRPVTDFIRLIRNWIREIWLKSHPKPNNILDK